MIWRTISGLFELVIFIVVISIVLVAVAANPTGAAHAVHAIVDWIYATGHALAGK